MMPARSRRVRMLCLLLASIPAWADPPTPRSDLLANPAEFVLHPPTRSLQPGPDLEAAFASGLLSDARTYWLANESLLELWTPGGKDLELRLTLDPHRSLVQPSLRLENDRLLLEAQPLPVGSPLVLRLPASALAPGLNRFQLQIEAASGTPPAGARWAVLRALEVLGQPESSPSSEAATAPKPGTIPVLPEDWTLQPGQSIETWLPASAARRLKVLAQGEGEPLDLGLYAEDGRRLKETRVRLGTESTVELPALHRPGRLILSAAPGPDPVRLERLQLEPYPTTPRMATAANPKPNLIIYLVDTCRADFLGGYGAAQVHTPNLDAFARDSLLLANGFALSPWTRTSVATLLTGHQPHRHKANTKTASLNPGLPTLAERLLPAGYFNEALITNGNVSDTFGFGRGYKDFQHLVETEERPEVHVRAGLVTDQLLTRLDRWKTSQPFHLYVHVTDPHFPYTPPETGFPLPASTKPAIAHDRQALMNGATRETLSPVDVDYLRQMHAAEITAVDEAFGRFLEGLKSAGLYDNSVILLTADHGEQFLEHGGVLHGYSFYGELIRVPLILKLPGGTAKNRLIGAAVSHLDIVPTFLAMAGLPVDPTLPGLDLLGDLRDPAVPVYTYHRGQYAFDGAADSRYLLILNHKRRGWRNRDRRPFLELYDRLLDPGETRSVAESWPGSVRYLLQKLEGMRRWVETNDRTVTPDGNLDPELLQTLEAVGYVD